VEHIETNLETIRTHAMAAEPENSRFRDFLKERNREQIDAAVFDLNKNISPKISCTDCGNCCKSLMVLISDPEADHLSAHLGQSRADFDREYLEKGSNGLMIMNRMPCPFLDNNKCSVYEHRFEGCKEFPALHLPNFKDRLFTTFMHYDRCPIIFNVIEQLKDTMGFQKDAEAI
jgi:Fe-S-cluster containining protein